MIEFKITKKHEITNEEISDLIVTALDGGINYWCGGVTVKQQPIFNWTFANEVIALNGILELVDSENTDEKWELTQEKFIKGLIKTMEHYDYNTVSILMDNHDAEVADVLIQYALFDEIVFG